MYDELIARLQEYAKWWTAANEWETPLCLGEDLGKAAAAIERLRELQTPCDLCIHNPPSSFDRKPCSMCPAQGRNNP